MEEKVQAVFYRYKYYIFPQEYADLTEISDGAVINAKRLKEERCMAPDFIYESIADETVEITDARLLFPVEVRLHSGKEYDAALSKQIDKVCRGCSRFIDNDDETLDGHHREISLDGVCYERETDGDVPTYAVRTYLFLSGLAEKADRIKKCIDAGNMKKLNKICVSLGWIPMPPVFYGDKHGGGYRLFWRSFGCDDMYLTLWKFTARAAAMPSSPIDGLGLELIPYIPADAEIKSGKFDLNEPLYAVEETPVPWEIAIKIYSRKKLSDKKANKIISELHGFLCNRKGGDKINRAVNGYGITHSDNGKLVSLNEIFGIIDKNDADLPVRKFPPAYPVSWENQDGALYGKRSFRGATSCYALSALGADAAEIPRVSFLGCTAYAYLFVPAALDTYDEISGIVSEYLVTEDDIPEPLIFKDGYLGCFEPIGGGECYCVDEKDAGGKEGVSFDFLVTDENAFYRFIKILAPVLKTYGARLVVVNGSGVNEYECGYKITPVGGTHAS